MKWETSGAERFFDAPCDVSADGFGFGLRERCMEADDEFGGKGEGVEVFFFEDYGDAEEFEFTDIGEAVDGVTGKAGNAFAKNDIDLPQAA